MTEDFPAAEPDAAEPESADSLTEGESALFALEAANHSVRALGGVESATLLQAIDAVEPQLAGRRALNLTLGPASTVPEAIEQIAGALADAAQKLWPLWWDEVHFPDRDDALGRLATGVAARLAAKEIFGVSASWAEAAARLAARGRAPRVAAVEPAFEVPQLARIIGRDGLALIADVGEWTRWTRPETLVRALEWTAERIDGAVIALFASLPPRIPPYERILYGAKTVRRSDPAPPEAHVVEAGAWIAPWRGLPHPMSEIEQRLARALGADDGLAPLFVFNKTLVTLRGATPKVDLVWERGRLVVEIDGYAAHGNRRAFVQDRHRDYELILSGFTVLRLTNDEILEDLERSMEKIRDCVALCRERMGEA